MNPQTQANFASQPSNGIWTQVDCLDIHLKHYPQLEARLQTILVVNDQSQFINLSAFYQSVLLRLKTFCQSYQADKKDEFNQGLTQLVNEILLDAPEVSPEVLLTFQVEKELFAVGVGGGSVLIVRNKVLGKILDSSSGITLVNGMLEYGDLVLACSNQFYNLLPYQVLKQMLLDRVGKFSLDTLVSELVVFFKRQPSDAGVAFVINQLVDEPKPESQNFKAYDFIKLPTWFKKFISTKTNLNNSEVYVKKEDLNRRKKILSFWGLMALVGLLSISLIIGRWRQEQKQIQTEIDQKTGPIYALKDEANTNLTLNPLKSRNLLQQALEQVATHKASADETSKLYQELTTLEQELSQQFQIVAAEHQVTLNQFMNLEFIKQGFYGEKLGLLEDQLLILDTGNNQALSLGIVNKNPSEVVNNSMLSGGIGITGALDYIYVLGSQGIINIDRESQETKVVIPTDVDWQNPLGFGAFSGNLYVLDTSVQELWRYKGVVNAEFVRQRWLAPGVNPDLSTVSDMEIDGDIWVLNRDGGVRKYTNGVGEEIPLVGLSDSIEAKAFGLNETQIVILDEFKHRIVVFDKEGTYQKQYIWDQSILVTDMVVFGDTVYLLSGSIVYSQKL